MSTPPLSRWHGAVVCSQASRAGGAPGRFRWPSALKDALRSGDVFLPDSRRHVSFWHLCYDEPAWQQMRESALDTLGLPTDGTAAVQALVREFHETAARPSRALASNPFARIEGGRLRLRRDPRQREPEGTAALRQLVRRDLVACPY